MKKLILIIGTILIFTNSYCQITITLKEGKIFQLPDEKNKKSIIVKKNEADVGKEFKADLELFNNYCKDNQDFGEIICTIDCTKKTITFSTKSDSDTKIPYYLCDKKGVFSLDQKDCDAKENENDEQKKPTDLIDFPLSKYDSKSDENSQILNNRTIIIDAKADKNKNSDITGLYKFKDKNKLIKAEALPINRYMSVMIQNYNFHKLERFTITVNSENYKYENDISKIYDLVTKKNKSSEESSNPDTEGANTVTKTPEQKKIKTYLDNVLRILGTYEYLNLNDLYAVEEYKESLIQYAKEHKEEFDSENNILKNNIISWNSKYVSLTPISIDIPDNDEVKITYSLKENGLDTESKSLGNFKTFGGVSVDYGAAFYLTDLRNNEIYTTTTGTEANNDVYTKANLSNSHNESIGFGLNIDVSYRTGLHFRPTFNFGFFVPLEEDITPFIATGPGVGFYSNNYKINLSCGLALGKVNQIKEQYQDANLAGLTLTNTDLTEKVLQTGHYYSLTLSFNIFK